MQNKSIFETLAWGAIFLACIMMVIIVLYLVQDVRDNRSNASKCDEIGGVYYSEYYSQQIYKCGKIERIKLTD